MRDFSFFFFSYSDLFCIQLEYILSTPATTVYMTSTRAIELRLTAIFLVAPVRTVAEAVAAEASDDAMDAIGAGEE